LNPFFFSLSTASSEKKQNGPRQYATISLSCGSMRRKAASFSTGADNAPGICPARLSNCLGQGETLSHQGQKMTLGRLAELDEALDIGSNAIFPRRHITFRGGAMERKPFSRSKKPNVRRASFCHDSRNDSLPLSSSGRWSSDPR
jgi:hypothetical protein